MIGINKAFWLVISCKIGLLPPCFEVCKQQYITYENRAVQQTVLTLCLRWNPLITLPNFMKVTFSVMVATAAK